ncbi:hypothetical protein PJI17_24260 [Mycobacterium kansasii]
MTALTVYGGREPPRSAALTAQSAPSAHTRRRKRTVGAASAQSAPQPHSRRRQRTAGAVSRRPNRASTGFPPPNTRSAAPRPL